MFSIEIQFCRPLNKNSFCMVREFKCSACTYEYPYFTVAVMLWSHTKSNNSSLLLNFVRSMRSRIAGSWY